jgi:hypothetical protein
MEFPRFNRVESPTDQALTRESRLRIVSQRLIVPKHRGGITSWIGRTDGIEVSDRKSGNKKRRLPKETAFLIVHRQKKSMSLAGLAATYSPRT